jgi:hypothetical protein
MCGEVKIVMNILNMRCDLQKVNMRCAVMENIISNFFFEEHLVTGKTFLATMEKTVLHHIPARTVFQSGGAPSHFSHGVHAFLGRELPHHWKGKGSPIPWPLCSLRIIFLDFSLLGNVYQEKVQSVSSIRGITNGVHTET